MSGRRARLALFTVAGTGVAVLFVAALLRLPTFGAAVHPYRTHAVPAAVRQQASNSISSINFDQRGLDTLGEESILLTSVMAVAVLLRREANERERAPATKGRILESTRLAGYALLPITLLLGADVIAHGTVTPGGGFQGGVVLGTGIHLLYVAGSYAALRRARLVTPGEWGEALGAGAFACLGIAGLLVGTAFLQNFLPKGSLGELFSGGTVPVLNVAVGIEVASGVIVLLAKFLEQAIAIEPDDEAANADARPRTEG